MMKLKNRSIIHITIILFFFSCNRQNDFVYIKEDADGRGGVIKFDLNIDIPDNLKSNLDRFLEAKIVVNIKIYQKKEMIQNFDITRSIKYDRWNNVYTIFNSYSMYKIKYYSYSKLISDLSKFEGVPVNINSDITDGKMVLSYELISVNFPPPFKILEFSKRDENIKKKNMTYYIYEEK